MARSKPNPHIVADRAEAESALGEMAALDRRITAIELEMQQGIDAAKDKAKQLITPLTTRKKELEDAVAVYARLNKQELFSKTRSLDLIFGVIGFRASTRLVQVRGVTAAMSLEKLHRYNFTDGIRVKEEINKEAALGWPDERLELVGLRRQQADTFYIELKQEDLPKEAA